MAQLSAADGAKAGPGGGDLTAFEPFGAQNRAFYLTGRPFLPRNRLLAGRFRPAMRFATRGPSLQALRGGPVGSGNFPAHRRARFLKTELEKEDAMTKRSEPKYKIDRRMGPNIWGRPK